MRRVIPFYTWTRKNMPLQIESFYKTPGKPALIADLMRDLPKGSEGDLEALPDWVKEGIFVKLGEGEKGPKYGYSISTIPFEELGRLWRGSPGRTLERELLGTTAPPIQTAIELVSQKDLFYNQPFETYAYRAGKTAYEAKLPKYAMDWLEYRTEEFTIEKGKDKGKKISRHWVNPAKFEMLTATPFSRFITTKASQDPIGAATSPFKAREFDTELETTLRSKERSKEIEEFLKKKGVLKEFTKTYVPKE